jgi:4-carboxymuconolactone decarboxylase
LAKPRVLEKFERSHPEVWKAYMVLRDQCDLAGPLDPKITELIKLGIETAGERKGGLKAHIHRAQAAGASEEEIYHAILLATPLIGLPSVLEAFQTAREALKRER